MKARDREIFGGGEPSTLHVQMHCLSDVQLTIVSHSYLDHSILSVLGKPQVQ